MSEREEPSLSSSESASLERGYRRLLACYPKWFRLQNEDEVLAVLMACAQDDQTRPSLEAAVDLLKGAARMRLRPRPGQPRTVFAAVRLLRLGAVAELGALLTILATTATVRAAVARSFPGTTVNAVSNHLFVDEVLMPAVIGVWLALAWAINRRRDPARIAVAAFFGLTTMSMLLALSVGSPVYATADFAAGMVVWFICLVSMVLVFTPTSNRYFRAEPAALASPAG
jgi:hypothetical protein